MRVGGSSVGGRGGGEVGLTDAEEVLVEGGYVGVLEVGVRLKSLLVLFLGGEKALRLGKEGLVGALQFDMPP